MKVLADHNQEFTRKTEGILKCEPLFPFLFWSNLEKSF